MASRYQEDPGAEREIVHLMGRLLDDVLPAIANDAKRYVPVLTGELRSKIGHEKLSDTHGRVYANTEYAAAVENGHVNARSGKHIPAQPYLRPAAYKHRDGGS